MIEFFALLFFIAAVLAAIATTMDLAETFTVEDISDIDDYNLAEMALLIWDARERYIITAGLLVVGAVFMVFG